MDQDRKHDPPKHGVLGSIAGKIASTSHLVRNKTEKINSRVHDHWRKPAHVPTKTVDEEFEDLVEELDAITEACQEIIKLHKHYISISIELVQSSQRVANSIQVLSTPSTVDTASEVPGALNASLCERTRSYAATMVEIGICLKESLRSIPENLDERVKRLLSYPEKIHERVAVRDRALMSFDRVYDKFDGMTILSTTNEFTPKQKQEYHALEKKLVELRRVYDDHNTLLKKELPCFFMLVRTFIEPLMQFLFFVQLTAAYQTQSNLVAVTLDLDDGYVPRTLPTFQSNTSRSSFLRLYHDDVSVAGPECGSNVPTDRSSRRRKAPNSQSTQDTKRPTTARDCSDMEVEYGCCRALFNFCSVVETDLEFKKGDVIRVISCDGEWWRGQLGEKEGLFPGSYVERI